MANYRFLCPILKLTPRDSSLTMVDYLRSWLCLFRLVTKFSTFYCGSSVLSSLDSLILSLLFICFQQLRSFVVSYSEKLRLMSVQDFSIFRLQFCRMLYNFRSYSPQNQGLISTGLKDQNSSSNYYYFYNLLALIFDSKNTLCMTSLYPSNDLSILPTFYSVRYIPKQKLTFLSSTLHNLVIFYLPTISPFDLIFSGEIKGLITGFMAYKYLLWAVMSWILDYSLCIFLYDRVFRWDVSRNSSLNLFLWLWQ